MLSSSVSKNSIFIIYYRRLLFDWGVGRRCQGKKNTLPCPLPLSLTISHGPPRFVMNFIFFGRCSCMLRFLSLVGPWYDDDGNGSEMVYCLLSVCCCCFRLFYHSSRRLFVWVTPSNSTCKFSKPLSKCMVQRHSERWTGNSTSGTSQSNCAHLSLTVCHSVNNIRQTAGVPKKIFMSTLHKGK